MCKHRVDLQRSIEVGYSESIGDLRDYARILLTRSARAIKVVVLVKYGYRADPLQLPADYFEVWKMGAEGTPRRSFVISRGTRTRMSTNALARRCGRAVYGPRHGRAFRRPRTGGFDEATLTSMV